MTDKYFTKYDIPEILAGLETPQPHTEDSSLMARLHYWWALRRLAAREKREKKLINKLITDLTNPRKRGQS